MDRYDFDTLTECKRKYIKRWKEILKTFAVPPIEDLSIQDEMQEHEYFAYSSLNYFLNKADSHLRAAKFALDSDNTHSLAVHCRVLIELNDKQSKHLLGVLLAKNTPDRIKIQENLILDWNKSFEAAMRLDPNTRHLIERKRIDPKQFLRSLNETDITESELEKLGRQNISYSPNLFKIYNKISAFLAENKEHLVEDFDAKEYKETSDSIAQNVQDLYKNLSENFIHSTYESLQRHVIFGGVFINDSNNDQTVKTYNILLFNSHIKWCISIAECLIDCHKQTINTRVLGRYRKKYRTRRKTNPSLTVIIEDFNSLLCDLHNFIQQDILNGRNFDAKSEQDLRLCKIFMHSVAFQNAAITLNFSALCVELSIMIENLNKLYIGNSEQPYNRNFYNIFKHPQLAHQTFHISQGGIRYQSIDGLAVHTIVNGYVCTLTMWAHVLISLCQMPKYKNVENELIQQSHEINVRIQRHSKTISSFVTKLNPTRV